MCDPITLTAAALTAAGTASNAIAGNNARKSQQSTMNANTKASAAEFDRRQNMVVGSDARVMDLTQHQYADASKLQDQTFSYLLDQSKTTADANDLVAKGLVTAQKEIQTQRMAAKAVDAAKQSGYLQKITDNIAQTIEATAPGSQQAYAAKDFANRLSTMTTAIGDPSTSGPSATADDLVKAAFASRSAAANAAGMAQGKALSNVSSMTDAASWADQLQTQGAKQNDLTAGRATLDKGFADDKQQTLNASDELAQQHATFATGLNNWLQQQHDSNQQTYAQNEGASQGDFYGRSLSSENNFTNAMTGASQHLEDTNTNLANYKISNTQADTTFGDLLKAGGSIVGGMSSLPKMPTFGSALTKANNSAVLTRTAPFAAPVAFG